MADHTTTSPSTEANDLSKEKMKEMYKQTLESALSSASSSFFSAHPSLSPRTQDELVSEWVESQQRHPFRPPTSAAADAVPNGNHQTTDANGKVEVIRPGGKKKVRAYIDGCYDIMHSGHYNAIRQAKSLCDELIVGVHSNEEIMKHKGPPVMNDEERLATVKACKWVDGVVFGTPYDPSVALLDELGCDFCVHGDDECTTADGRDPFEDVKSAGRMAIVKRTEGVSTTDLVGRLLQATKNHHAPRSPSIIAASMRTIPTGEGEEGGVEGEKNGGGKVPELTLPPPHASIPTAATSSHAQLSPSLTSPVPTPSPLPPLPAPTGGAALPGSALSTFLPTTWRISQFANHRVPRDTDKVVYMAGSFDLFHLGHIEKLEEAKKLGTFLYVGLYDDSTVNSYKGRNYPIMSHHERVLNVLSCKVVDEVVIGAPLHVTPQLIKALKIDVVARAVLSESTVKRNGGKNIDNCAAVRGVVPVVDIQARSSLSTDLVIQRILDNRAKYEARNAKRAAKEQAAQQAAQEAGITKQYVQEK